MADLLRQARELRMVEDFQRARLKQSGAKEDEENRRESKPEDQSIELPHRRAELDDSLRD